MARRIAGDLKFRNSNLMDEEIEFMATDIPAQTTSTCRLVRAGEEFQGKQGLMYAPGISAESAGSRGIHLQFVTLPPGARAKAHKHAAHETAIYVLSGISCMWYGERLEHHFEVKTGDFLYIPADMPHLPYNPSKTESCVAIIARTDPNEQESVILLPELEREDLGI